MCDITHTAPPQVKKEQAQALYKPTLFQQEEKTFWLKNTDAYKFANDGSKAVFLSHVGIHTHTQTHTHTRARVFL